MNYGGLTVGKHENYIPESWPCFHSGILEIIQHDIPVYFNLPCAVLKSDKIIGTPVITWFAGEGIVLSAEYLIYPGKRSLYDKHKVTFTLGDKTISHEPPWWSVDYLYFWFGSKADCIISKSNKMKKKKH